MENIEEVLNKYNIKNYTINKDGSVNLTSDVSFFNKDIDKIPFNIKSSTGIIDFSYNNLTSLEGCPEVAHSIFFSRNKIKEIDCVPMESKLLSLSNNEIEELNFPEGFNSGEIILRHNKIYDLKGIPSSFNGKIFLQYNPIDALFKSKDGSDVNTFNSLNIIKGKKVNLKRLKYFYNIIGSDEIELDLEEIKKYYEIV